MLPFFGFMHMGIIIENLLLGISRKGTRLGVKYLKIKIQILSKYEIQIHQGCILNTNMNTSKVFRYF